MAMDSVRLSQPLQDFFRTETTELAGRFGSITRLMEVLAKFWYGLSIPSDLGLTEVERSEKCWYFPWWSRSDQATCPIGHTVSRHSAKRYTDHTVQDFPLDGKTVYHRVTNTRYIGDQPDCPVYTCVEPLDGFAGSGARWSNRWKTFLIRLALGSSLNALPPTLSTLGIAVPSALRSAGTRCSVC